jgi:hypothetical protein
MEDPFLRNELIASVIDTPTGYPTRDYTAIESFIISLQPKIGSFLPDKVPISK